MSPSTRSRARKRNFARGLAVSALALATAAGAAEAPAYLREALPQAAAFGRGKLTWFGVHLYDAVLYAGADFDPAQPFARPFALELTYVRPLSGARIADASRDEIARLGFGDEAARARWHAAMRAIFPDVIAGSQLAGLYRPQQGATFYADGRALAAIDDEAFARAFFSIWLDERSSAPRLRAALLRLPR